MDHQLQIHADRYLPTNGDLIPKGMADDVSGTAFDFRTFCNIEHPDVPGGYDHIFCLSETPMPERVVARLKGSTGDWEMTLATTEPGLQVYVGPGIEAPLPGLAGTQNPGFAGVALEPQRWPNVVDAQYPMGSFLGTQSGYHQVTTFQFGRQT